MIKPIDGRALVKVDEPIEKTKGGIYIPTQSKVKTETGVIVSLAEDYSDELLKVGMKIMFDKFSGTAIKENDQDYLLLVISDIIAIVEE